MSGKKQSINLCRQFLQAAGKDFCPVIFNHYYRKNKCANGNPVAVATGAYLYFIKLHKYANYGPNSTF